MSTEKTTVTVEATALTQDENAVELDTPVKRGESTIAVVTLRKPSSGELRGIQLSDLLQMDVGALIKLVPRISLLTEGEVRAMDPADLVAIGVKVTGFLLQKRTKTDASLVA
ncbi:phage tail assembly protein [Pseudomonas sp. KCJK9044]|uniref:phage tail assembly protein n=1 Tax=Pseudomonas sp. KCJK9044 TaxID=3344562 RepID=UPI003905C40A